MTDFKRRFLHYLIVVLMSAFLVLTAFSQLQASILIQSQGTVYVAGASTYEVWAASGSVEHIQAAVNNVRAHGTGTVRIPAGAWLFDATPTNRVQSYGGINIIGAGMFQTNLTLRADATYSQTIMFNIDGSNQLPFRISGITFIGRTASVADATGDTALALDVCKDFRIDHCSFHKMGSNGIAARSLSNKNRANWLLNQGVVDHCNFYDIYKAGAVSAGTGYGYGVAVAMTDDSSKVPWPADPRSLMGNATDTVFIEDCYFAGARHAVMSFLGGRYVVRYCTIEKPCVSVDGGQWMIDAHPPRNYGNDVYGGRWAEVYNNTLIGNTVIGSTGGWQYGVTIDGGSAFITNNTISGSRLYYAYGFDLSTSQGVSAGFMEKAKPWYVYIWNNVETYNQRVYSPQEGTLVNSGVNYKFVNPATDGFIYKPYTYPHPLTLRA